MASEKGAGENSAAVQIRSALYLIGCLVVAFLTLVLKDAANRSMNGYAAGASLVTVSLRLNLVGTFGAAGAVITFFVILTLLLIIWHAWKWPVEMSRDGVERGRPAAPGPG